MTEGSVVFSREPVTGCQDHPNPSFLPFSQHSALRSDTQTSPAEYRLAAIGIVKRFEAGSTIHLEGETSEYCYKVLSGLVKEQNTLNDGRCQVAGFYTDGDLFAMTCRETHLHTAEAITETLLVAYPRARFFEIVSGYPTVFSRLICDVMDRLTSAREQAILLGRMTAVERVAAFLAQLASRKGSGSNDGQIRIDMSRRDIADYLGLTIETICRVLSHLKKKGVIRMETPSSIRICSKDALAAVLEKL